MRIYNDINICRFDVQIRISESDYENLDAYTLHRKIESFLDSHYNHTEGSNILKQYITDYFEEIHLYDTEKLKIIYPPLITNYQERTGSLLVSFTLILITSLITYDTVRGAIERFLEDFSSDFKIRTNNNFNITSNISYNEELYSKNNSPQQFIKDNVNVSSQNTGVNIDDCIKLIQLLNINNQNNINKEQDKKNIIIKYICITIAFLITAFLIWNQFYNDTEKIKNIIHTEIEKYKNQEKINKLDSYYHFQQHFSIYKANELSSKTDSVK